MRLTDIHFSQSHDRSYFSHGFLLGLHSCVDFLWSSGFCGLFCKECTDVIFTNEYPFLSVDNKPLLLIAMIVYSYF